MKKTLFILSLAGLLNISPVHTLPAGAAGIPVIDAAAISQDATNFARQLMEMANQLNTMKSQLQQQVQQYQSLVGDRGMGQLLNGEVRNYIPNEWRSALSVLDQPSGYSGMADNIQNIISQNKVLTDTDLEKLSPEVRQIVEQERKSTATHKALGEAAFKNASERFNALQSLTNQIGAATDPKAIMDLQARIQTEQNALTNEGNKLQSMSETLKSEELIRQQRKREILAKSGGQVE